MFCRAETLNPDPPPLAVSISHPTTYCAKARSVHLSNWTFSLLNSSCFHGREESVAILVDSFICLGF